VTNQVYRRVSEEIVDILEANGIDTIFGITGAGNIQLFDALNNSGKFNLIFTHHEQAAVMAASTYYRASGKLAVALVTTGGGSTNALTGLVSANMDSIPVLVIGGNEPSRYSTVQNPLRVWGIQGFDSISTFSPVVKFASRVSNPDEVQNQFEEAITQAISGKPGVSWVEVPLDVQTMKSSASVGFPKKQISLTPPEATDEEISSVVNSLRSARKPVLWLGNGIRSSNSVSLIAELVEKLDMPFLLSWAGADLITNDHRRYVGRAGVYGQRAANLVLQGSDYILAIGTRLAIPQIGYSLDELAPDAKIDVVDIDFLEANKHQNRVNEAITSDAGIFLQKLSKSIDGLHFNRHQEWLSHVNQVRLKFPTIEDCHADTDFMNSYRVIDKMQEFFAKDETIVTDMGTALLSGHHSLSLIDSQRLITSTGLGEMGFGLPAALGVAFANPNKRVICLNADGGMMMNLQEIQTIKHHNLPVKIFIFNNDGYQMIKRSQISLLGGRFVGVNAESGLSCPDFSALATAFGIKSWRIDTYDDLTSKVPEALAEDGPAICEISMDPAQAFLPRLQTVSSPNGTLVSPPLEDLSPFLPLDQLEWALGRKPNPRSYELRGLQ
jgi:acetolactate synthase-1/2/3 large subunit